MIKLMLINNIWSVDEDKSINFFYLQYFINYNLPDGLYLTSPPILTSDWTAEPGEQWTIPFGAGIGKIIKLG